LGPELARVRDLTIRRARPSDAAALARVQVDSWRETYRGMLPESHLAALSYAGHERLWRRTLAGPNATFLAVIGGQIVGLASGGRCRLQWRWMARSGSRELIEQSRHRSSKRRFWGLRLDSLN